MEYRINKRTGDRISEIGLGSAYLCDADMDEAVQWAARCPAAQWGPIEIRPIHYTSEA